MILAQRGHQVSTKFAADLMREMGLSSIRNTAKQDYLKLRGPEKKKNILRQQFSANKPDQIWVSDVTCFKLENRYLYICAILDLFSRKVVAYKVSPKTTCNSLRPHSKWCMNCVNQRQDSFFTVTAARSTHHIVFSSSFMNRSAYSHSQILEILTIML